MSLFACYYLVTQSCPTLCDSMDYSLPGSLSMGFPSREYWNGLPFPSPQDFLNPRIKTASPHLLYCRQILYHQLYYTTQSNLQIQCNPYQITNGIFHRTRTKHFTICMETQKTLNSQNNQERKMKLEESTDLTSDYTTKLQSSRQYGVAQKQRYRPI